MKTLELATVEDPTENQTVNRSIEIRRVTPVERDMLVFTNTVELPGFQAVGVPYRILPSS